MTAFVDTNVLVRHLTGDPKDMAQRATSYLRDSEALMVCDLVVAEVVYVLEAYLVACAEASGVTDIASFDRSLDRVTTIQRVEP